MKTISGIAAALLILASVMVLPASAGKGGHGQHRENIQPKQPRHSERAEAWQRDRQWQKHGGWQGYETWDGGRAQHWKVEHRTWIQRGGYGGYYITRQHYGLYFGPKHVFRIQSPPVIYMGYPRFVYQGYSFLLVDPWPEDWDVNWYATDDVYIYYDRGYYLYNPRRPGFALAVTIVQ